MAGPPAPSCPRCRAEVAATAAICPHCGSYLLDWSGGRFGPSSPPPDARPAPRPPLVQVRRPPPIDTRTTLAALRLVVAVGMAIHGLAVLARLADDPLLLLGWIALWLPIDAYTRRRGRP